MVDVGARGTLTFDIEFHELPIRSLYLPGPAPRVGVRRRAVSRDLGAAAPAVLMGELEHAPVEPLSLPLLGRTSAESGRRGAEESGRGDCAGGGRVGDRCGARSGYSSVSAYIAAFKQTFGATPGAIRWLV